MDSAVLALGLALVTLAGYVWYVPALLVLRAGDDRPLSQRTASAACVTGWGTTAVMSAVLFLGLPAPAAATVGAVGWTAAITVRLRAVRRRHRERAEGARAWSALLGGGGARP